LVGGYLGPRADDERQVIERALGRALVELVQAHGQRDLGALPRRGPGSSGRVGPG
ncbi:hypothetical protein GS504_00545, partial [Rhodococcus hoagii]|nr:hypothetical protein [Prescottella equi]